MARIPKAALEARAAQPTEPKVHNVDNLLTGFGAVNWGLGGDFFGQTHLGTENLTYTWLRQSARLAIAAAWIGTRTNQVADFVRPSQGPGTAGVTVRLIA